MIPMDDDEYDMDGDYDGMGVMSDYQPDLQAGMPPNLPRPTDGMFGAAAMDRSRRALPMGAQMGQPMQYGGGMGGPNMPPPMNSGLNPRGMAPQAGGGMMDRNPLAAALGGSQMPDPRQRPMLPQGPQPGQRMPPMQGQGGPPNRFMQAMRRR